jgi:serpin B
LKAASFSNDIGVQLFFRLPSAAKQDLLLSPLSVSTAVLMLSQGAEGGTRAAFEKAMRLGGHDTLGAQAVAAMALRNWLRPATEAVTLKFANGLWAARGIKLRPSFSDIQSKLFGAQIDGVDFANPATLTAINAWIGTATSGKITQAFDAMPPETDCVLASTMYFNGKWRDPFSRDKTRRRPFAAAGDASINVAMMSRSGMMAYRETNEFQSVALPYADPRFEMVIVLPRHKEAAVRNMLTADWQGTLDRNRYGDRQGELELPKFSASYDVDLLKALQQTGYAAALGPGADFGGMAEGRFDVSAIRHKATLDVSEEGTEAAAVTAILTTRALAIGSPFKMQVDHPFYIVLRERQTGAILMVGYIAHPVSAPG